jgi:large subunit ribosomal protein L3
MGGEQVTVQNLEVIKIDLEKNVMLIKGNVPGAKNSFVIVTNAVKKSSAAINPEALA